MERPGPARSRLLLGLLACILLGVLHTLYFWPEVIDDAFITFRYARNYVNGHGMSFNPGGPAVEGFSNVTWFWLSVLGLKLGLRDLLVFVKVVGIVLHAATIVGVWVLVGGFGRERRAVMLLAPLLFAANPFAAYHAVAGLETPFYMASIVACAISILGLAERPRLAFPALAVALALLSWTRPEAFGYALGLVAGGWLYHRHDPPARARVLQAALIWLIALGALLAWRWTSFGQWLPNTVTAKSAGPSGQESIRAGLQYAGRFYNSLYYPADVVIYVLAAVSLLRSPGRREAFLLVPVLCATVFSIAVRGDWMHSFRFMVAATPFLSALIGCAALAALERRPLRSLRTAGRIAAVAIAGVLALFLLQHSMANTMRSSEDSFGRNWKTPTWPLHLPARLTEGFPARLAGFTRWSLEHVSPRHVVATGDIGFPAWTVDEQIVDLAGLTDRELGRVIPAHDVDGYRAVMRHRAPDVIVFRIDDGRPAALYDGLTDESGILAGYALVDTVETYGDRAMALIYQRRGTALAIHPDSVLARYDRAIDWNPRVSVLRRWREEYRTRLVD
jgi:hypothetical protein